MTKDPKKRALSPKRKKFAKKYVANTGNATQSAKDAGYGEKGAGTEGHRLLQNVDVQEEITVQAQKIVTADSLTPADVTAALLKEANMDGGKREETSGGTRVRALELLGKSFGMFKDVTISATEGMSGHELVVKLVREGAPNGALGMALDLKCLNHELVDDITIFDADTGALFKQALAVH